MDTSKPNTLPVWATNQEARVVEPLQSQKEAGWRYQDTPSSPVVNWWMNNVYQWVAFLDGFTDKLQKQNASQDDQLKQLQEKCKELERRVVALEQASQPSEPIDIIREPDLIDRLPDDLIRRPIPRPRPRPGPDPRPFIGRNESTNS